MGFLDLKIFDCLLPRVVYNTRDESLTIQIIISTLSSNNVCGDSRYVPILVFIDRYLPLIVSFYSTVQSQLELYIMIISMHKTFLSQCD